MRTKKNIERVRRDEAEAAAKEKELAKRTHIANFEASLDILRKRNGTGSRESPGDDDDNDRPNGAGEASSSPPTAKVGGAFVDAACTEENSSSVNNDDQTLPSSKSVDTVNPSGSSSKVEHLNLFRDVELAEGKLHGGNLEAAADKKRDQEDWERKVGILQYLGQSSNNADGNERFYQRLEKTVTTVGAVDAGEGGGIVDSAKTADATTAALTAARKRDQREKDAQDPLRTIQKYLLQKKPDRSTPSSPRASSPCASTAVGGAGGSSGSNSVSLDLFQRQNQADLRRIEFLPEGVSNVKRKASSTSGDKRRRPSISSSSTDDEYTRRQRKRKKAKKSKRRRTPSSESDPESEEERRHRKRSNLDLLRRQRLEREEKEHRRTREYLASLVGKVSDKQGGGSGSAGGSTKDHAGPNDPAGAGGDTDRNRRYNSQYNPHLARY